MEIRFDIKNPAEFFEFMHNPDFFSISAQFEIVLLLADGTEVLYATHFSGTSHMWDDHGNVTRVTADFGGRFIDVENLAGIRINGVTIVF